ncbi:unnamed protein product [Meganyctiphanes norvegica]|uniref:Uncharacterized protein n=1 Tax=Meganyctiphanes norvegica TaxID=48144 RepID=A0AAV2RC13_MEGNR
MVHSYDLMRPSTSHSGTYRIRSSSVSRYPSPARSNYGSTSCSRAGTSIASYGSPSLRTALQETKDVPYSSPRGALRSTSTTSGSSRRSSFSRGSSVPPQKHVHFKEEVDEIDTTTLLIRDKGTFGLESRHGFNRLIEGSLPRPSLEDINNDRMKISSRNKFHIPSANDDTCRRRQARATYLSSLDDTGIAIRNRDRIY